MEQSVVGRCEGEGARCVGGGERHANEEYGGGVIGLGNRDEGKRDEGKGTEPLRVAGRLLASIEASRLPVPEKEEAKP